MSNKTMEHMSKVRPGQTAGQVKSFDGTVPGKAHDEMRKSVLRTPMPEGIYVESKPVFIMGRNTGHHHAYRDGQGNARS